MRKQKNRVVKLLKNKKQQKTDLGRQTKRSEVVNLSVFIIFHEKELDPGVVKNY